MSGAAPFWREKSLEEFSAREWEALCDGCGNCCLHVFEVPDDGYVKVPVACRLLAIDTCRCSDYPQRQERVPSCTVLTPDNILEKSWLPQTCAYRRLARGEELPEWHYLRSGDPEAVHRLGISVRGRALSELHADPWDALVELLSDGENEDVDPGDAS